MKGIGVPVIDLGESRKGRCADRTLGQIHCCLGPDVPVVIQLRVSAQVKRAIDSLGNGIGVIRRGIPQHRHGSLIVSLCTDCNGCGQFQIGKLCSNRFGGCYTSYFINLPAPHFNRDRSDIQAGVVPAPVFAVELNCGRSLSRLAGVKLALPGNDRDTVQLRVSTLEGNAGLCISHIDGIRFGKNVGDKAVLCIDLSRLRIFDIPAVVLICNLECDGVNASGRRIRDWGRLIDRQL